MLIIKQRSNWLRFKWTLILLPFCALNLSAGNIQFQVTNTTGSVYRYDFFPSGFAFVQNEELDIRFDPNLFANLVNGVAGPDFRVTLLQPNNPPGAFGDYSALALVSDPSFAGPFSVDVTWLGSGTPGQLPYVIHQFDASGRVLDTLGAGVVGTPEPAGWLLSGAALALSGLLRIARRRH